MQQANQTTDPQVDLTQFEDVLMDEQSPRGKLWKAWHFLQVYSTWAVRLPYTIGDLSNYLKIPTNELGTFLFFAPMQEAYTSIHNSAQQFLSETFPRVVKLGNSLRSFAEENKGGEESIWAAITELVADKENYPDILELVQDLQSRALENVKEADAIAVLLSTYSTGLEQANGKLKIVDDNVEADAKTSQATIDRLQAGANVSGSIAQLRELMKKNKKAYDSAVVKASTTPTYAWIVPFGTIAAAVVAGIYGKAAVDSLSAYNKAMKKLAEENRELETAINTRQIMLLANQSIDNTREQTAQAIEQITIVKNAWAGLAASLEVVKNKVNAMTKTTDAQEVVLKSKTLIKLYAKQASTAWDKLWPAIVELTDEPYIVVEQEGKSVDQVVSDIELNMANPALAN